jgi:hypothetical protein
MRNKSGLRVLAISIAIVIVASSVALHGLQKVESEITEGGGQGIISLMAPPFIIGVASASPANGGSGVAARAGTVFLEEEAGISAHVNVGQKIDLEKAKSAFKSIETANDTYIIGQIALDGYDPEYVAPHAYVHEDGWIVTYYLRNEPSGKIMQWNAYDGGTITTTTLADTIKTVCEVITFNYDTIKSNVRYYDFEYPNANRMMLITEWIAGRGTQSDQFNLTIPIECELYEASWSHYCQPSRTNNYFRVKITDEDYYPVYTISELTDVAYYRYGIFTPEQLSVDDTLHMVIVEQYVSSGYYGQSCVSFALIYRTS